MTLTVQAVGADRQLADAWVDVGWQRHGTDPNWVPPLRTDLRNGMDRRSNPFLRHADVEHFVLLDGDQAVGRIAATDYPAFQRRFGVRSGFFGFLSCPEDRQSVRMLTRAAEGWLAERGMDRVAGPYNYFSGQEMGLLVAGFDRPPAVFQSYNPPSYPALLGDCGYRAAFRAHTYRIVGEQLDRVTAQVRAAADRVRGKLGVRSRALDMRRYRDEMELIRQLFNRSFADNHDVLPYERDVFESMVLPLRRFVDPELIRIVERGGEPVAFAVTVPDVNHILRRLNGSVGLLDLLRLPALRRQVRGAVVLLVGVLPDQPMGMGQVLFAETLQAIVARGYRVVDTSWVHEHNKSVEVLLTRMCGLTPDRTYAIVERDLEPS